jgi:hypothetical protein
MRWKLGLALAALATAGLVLVFVALAASDEAAAWRELPAPPLSPRETPTGFWTGEEVVLVGGSDAPPCPPTAACSVPSVAPLADGAAYDPAIGAWRAIADAPVGFSWAEPELIDGIAYLWIAGENGRPNAPSAFLAYRIEEDRWKQFDLPTRDLGWHEVLSAGDRIVAHTYDDSDGERPDYVFETQTSTWRELPDDPFDDPYSRELAWDGSRLLLFDHRERDESSEAPLRGAAFDFERDEWQLLDDPEAVLENLPERETPPQTPELAPAAEAYGGTTEVLAGDDLFVFLGSEWSEPEGRLHSRGWLWSPRSE